MISPARRHAALAAILTCALSLPAAAAPQGGYDVAEKSIAQLQAALASGQVTSVELVSAYEARIERMDGTLRSVLALNPAALEQARASDAARRRGEAGGPLAGIPILVKDNVETSDPVATTAGSLVLKNNLAGRDAPLVARLRTAGAIILGKTNLSEWANYRSIHSISGWSGVGGQTRNPYAFDRNACGSSSGSGAASAASFAAAAIGTETDGSVTCPAAINGLVGLKPTVGLIPRTHVVPISRTQDTAGPMARSVRDVAVLLQAMAGADPGDPASAFAPAGHDFTSSLRPDALRGARIGVMRYASHFHPGTSEMFERALAVLRAQGAVLVDIDKFPNDADLRGMEKLILQTEMKADLNAYLATTSPMLVKARTLADVIAFDQAHAAEEMPLFGQDLFEASEQTKGLDDPAYLKARADARRYAGPEGIDAMLKTNGVSALVAPTLGPSWLIDPVLKDRFVSGGAGGPAANAGYPHLTVPMGLVDGLPVGLSFIGTAWAEAKILAYGYAYEQASHARAPPRYLPTVVLDPVATAAEGPRR